MNKRKPTSKHKEGAISIEEIEAQERKSKVKIKEAMKRQKEMEKNGRWEKTVINGKESLILVSNGKRN